MASHWWTTFYPLPTQTNRDTADSVGIPPQLPPQFYYVRKIFNGYGSNANFKFKLTDQAIGNI